MAAGYKPMWRVSEGVDYAKIEEQVRQELLMPELAKKKRELAAQRNFRPSPGIALQATLRGLPNGSPGDL